MTESPGTRTPARKQLTASGAEVVFLVFLVAFGMGLGVWVERAFTSLWKEPTEQQFLSKPSIREKQEWLTRLESSIKETEKQLDTATLEQLKHTATLHTFEKSYPDKASRTAEVQKNLETATMQQLAASSYAALLDARVSSLKKEAEKTAKELEPEKQAAAEELARRKWIYLVAKFAAVLLLPLPVVLLAMFVGTRFFNRVAKRRVWMSHGSLPILLVLCALLILLAYQAFQIAGAVLIGMILFLILLRKIHWSPAVSEKESE